jgi:hypothetical protein
MSAVQNAGKIRAATVRERPSHRSLTVAARIFSLALICIAAGCESGFGSKHLGDPLLGINAAPKSPASSSTPSNTATAQATSGPVPPLPSSYTSPGTAPMAVGETATPENPRPLRMAADTVSPAAVPVAGAARGAAPAVTVGNPEPAPAPAPASTTANLTKPPVPLPSGSAANIRTYEEAQQFLKQQRVSWQRLDMEDGQWKFECGVPNPSNPRMNRHYATSRAFPDALSAMREVITQIEKGS